MRAEQRAILVLAQVLVLQAVNDVPAAGLDVAHRVVPNGVRLHAAPLHDPRAWDGRGQAVGIKVA